MEKGKICNCLWTMLKLNSRAMDVKTSWIASCIPMHLVHGHILIDAYPMGQWVEYKCNEESMLLKDGANQAKICKAWIRLLTIDC